MIDVLKLLMGGQVKIPGLDVQPGGKISISIPSDHPKAGKILALAQALATRKTLDSGIVIDTGPNDVSVDRFLNLLLDVVGPEEFDRVSPKVTRVPASVSLDDLASMGEQIAKTISRD